MTVTGAAGRRPDRQRLQPAAGVDRQRRSGPARVEVAAAQQIGLHQRQEAHRIGPAGERAGPLPALRIPIPGPPPQTPAAPLAWHPLPQHRPPPTVLHRPIGHHLPPPGHRHRHGRSHTPSRSCGQPCGRPARRSTAPQQTRRLGFCPTTSPPTTTPTSSADATDNSRSTSSRQPVSCYLRGRAAPTPASRPARVPRSSGTRCRARSPASRAWASRRC